MYKQDVTDTDFRSIFYQNLPHKPWCADELPGYMDIRPKDQALTKRLIQINPPCFVGSLVFDVDHKDSFFAWSDANLPKPNWISRNPETLHAHVGYMLATPVCTSDNARQKIVRYLARVQEAYRIKLRADAGYVGLIAKNPFHNDWDNHIYENIKPYQLNYLADFVDLPLIPKQVRDINGLGRNCTLFDLTRIWAYERIRELPDVTSSEWDTEVLSHALNVNTAFTIPLPYNEVNNTARSISGWVWKKHREAHARFIQRQSNKGKIGAVKANAKGACNAGGKARSQQYTDIRQQALKLHLQGLSATDIAKELRISRTSVYTYLKSVKVPS